MARLHALLRETGKNLTQALSFLSLVKGRATWHFSFHNSYLFYTIKCRTAFTFASCTTVCLFVCLFVCFCFSLLFRYAKHLGRFGLCAQKLRSGFFAAVCIWSGSPSKCVRGILCQCTGRTDSVPLECVWSLAAQKSWSPPSRAQRKAIVEYSQRDHGISQRSSPKLLWNALMLRQTS